jgi:hypothetical protein
MSLREHADDTKGIKITLHFVDCVGAPYDGTFYFDASFERG